MALLSASASPEPAAFRAANTPMNASPHPTLLTTLSPILPRSTDGCTMSSPPDPASSDPLLPSVTTTLGPSLERATAPLSGSPGPASSASSHSLSTR